MPEAVEHAVPEPVRLDKWLWAARFYKTRQLAIEAVNAGHVDVNNERAKPSKTLAVGDAVTVRKPPVQFVLVVKALSAQRRAAPLARALYDELAESIAARERLEAELRTLPPPLFKGRPTKRDRRLLDKHFGRDGEGDFVEEGMNE